MAEPTIAQDAPAAIGLALGAWVTGLLLTGFGYVPNIEQTANSLLGIRLSMSAFPAAMLVAAALLMKVYPLDDKLMVQIEADLKARKQAEDRVVYLALVREEIKEQGGSKVPPSVIMRSICDKSSGRFSGGVVSPSQWR